MLAVLTLLGVLSVVDEREERVVLLTVTDVLVVVLVLSSRG